jgi:hypothetical protein
VCVRTKRNRRSFDLSTTLRSGRDDKVVLGRLWFFQSRHGLKELNNFVISTGAHSDFLLRQTPASCRNQVRDQYKKRSKGFARLIRPMYAPRQAGAGGANMGHPSRFYSG